jgi:hypothetical protein
VERHVYLRPFVLENLFFFKLKERQSYTSLSSSHQNVNCSLRVKQESLIHSEPGCLNELGSWITVEEAGVPGEEPPTMGKQQVNFITCS